MAALPEAKKRFPVLEIRRPGNPNSSAPHLEIQRPLRSFSSVPTYAVGYDRDRRCSPRAALSLPLRLIRVNGIVQPAPVTLVTRNISATGIFFLAPRLIDPGMAVELEVWLVERPCGQGSVCLTTAAHVVRAEQTYAPGWRGYAATFDDISFLRDEILPNR